MKIRNGFVSGLCLIGLLAGDTNAAIDFNKQIKPVLEVHCVSCHSGERPKGRFGLENKQQAFDDPEIINAGKPDDSVFVELCELGEDDDDVMPPLKNGLLAASQVKLLRDWVGEGAKWPDGVTLKPQPKVNFVKSVQPILESLSKKQIETVLLWMEQGGWMPSGVELTPQESAADPDAAERETVTQIREQIVKKLPAQTEQEMKELRITIPGTETEFVMVPIPGGEFTMGSPADEANRKADEGPQRKVKIAPFWMGKVEVTWNEFELFMYKDEERKYKDFIPTDPAVDKVSDAVARPTQPYVEMSFGMGKDGYPAISMTQHAARKYTEWISAKTGYYFRLPTEAEWEYACRAGTTTAYSWGDDPADIGEYAWYEDNGDFKYQKVGKKLPNPWGLHDMHGNVAEWVLDAYSPNYDSVLQQTDNPYNRPVQLYPRVARGGSWDHPAGMARSASRLASEADWKIQDPQLPKSIWYHTDAQFLGFRLLIPLKVDEVDKMMDFWNGGQGPKED